MSAKKRKDSKRLVIDASVAQSAGGEGATYPIAKRCRDFLTAVLSVCHRAVMTPDLQGEWREHQSSFARRWLVQMYGRKKVARPENVVDEVLREKIEQLAENIEEREAMWKDVGLIEAALATDRIVVSRDEKARGLFASIARYIRELREIVWVNPTVEEEQVIRWLEDGAPPDRERQLGFIDEEDSPD